MHKWCSVRVVWRISSTTIGFGSTWKGSRVKEAPGLCACHFLFFFKHFQADPEPVVVEKIHPLWPDYHQVKKYGISLDDWLPKKWLQTVRKRWSCHCLVIHLILITKKMKSYMWCGYTDAFNWWVLLYLFLLLVMTARVFSAWWDSCTLLWKQGGSGCNSSAQVVKIFHSH